jgi:hypothetical protein
MNNSFFIETNKPDLAQRVGHMSKHAEVSKANHGFLFQVKDNNILRDQEMTIHI